MKNQSLAISTPSDREIRITRTFEAPRAMVFDAFTKPELVRRWLFGPDGWEFEVCDIDLRPGGEYRYVWHRPSDGQRMGSRGVFREVAAPARFVFTERFDEAWYPGEAIVTVELTESARSTTTLTQTVLYETPAARDAVLNTGATEGLAAGYDRIETILATANPAA